MSPPTAREAAAADARDALELDPRAWRAELVQAELARAHGDGDEAESRADSAVRHSRHPQAWLVRAWARWERGDAAGAEADLLSALARTTAGLEDGRLTSAERAQATALLARSLVRRGRAHEARLRADEALRLDPEQAVAWAARGLASLATWLGGARQPETLERALADLSQAAAREPGCGDALVWRAEVLLAAGRPEEALRDLEQARPLLAAGQGEVPLRAWELLQARVADALGRALPPTARSDAELEDEEDEESLPTGPAAEQELLRLLLVAAALDEEEGE